MLDEAAFSDVHMDLLIVLFVIGLEFTCELRHLNIEKQC